MAKKKEEMQFPPYRVSMKQAKTMMAGMSDEQRNAAKSLLGMYGAKPKRKYA